MEKFEILGKYKIVEETGTPKKFVKNFVKNFAENLERNLKGV